MPPGSKAGVLFFAVLPGLLFLAATTAAGTSDGVGTRTITLPSPDFTLDIGVAQGDRVLTYTIAFTNIGEGAAKEVTLRDILPEGATYLGDPADLQNGIWIRTYEAVPPGAYEETIAAELPTEIADGTSIVNLVVLEYVGYTGPRITKTYEHEFVLNGPIVPAEAMPLWAALAPVGVALTLAGGFAAYRVGRRPRFEQVFLMHSSGMLIHHWAASVSPGRDIDILSGMFVILREFVRDSFRDKPGGLTELQFGDSRVFLAEGEHAILAAVLNGNHVNGLPAQVQAAVRDFERWHGAELVEWSGALERLPGAKAIVDRLVRGGYGVRHRRLFPNMVAARGRAA